MNRKKKSFYKHKTKQKRGKVMTSFKHKIKMKTKKGEALK
jgi:hypothetical protein